MNVQTRGLFRTTLVVGALLLGAAATAGPSRPDPEPNRWVAVGSTKNSANPKCNGVNNANCPGSGPVKAFGVTLGQIPLMFPGSSSPLWVEFSNPEAFPIRVQTIQVSKALAVPSEDCPIGELTVLVGTHTYPSPIVVPARGTARAPSIAVGLASSADSRCERAAFTIDVVASAVK